MQYQGESVIRLRGSRMTGNSINGANVCMFSHVFSIHLSTYSKDKLLFKLDYFFVCLFLIPYTHLSA